MHGWESVDTGRCVRCAIYTEKSDLLFGHDGRAYCLSCGVPPVPRSTQQQPQPTTREDVVWVAALRSPIEQRARVVAGAMLLLTLAFPLTACVSQL